METKNDKRQLSLLLAATSLGIIATPLLSSLFNIAQDAIVSDFGIQYANVPWFYNFYLLSVVVFLVPAGRLSQIFGKKKIFEAGTIITLAALVAGYFAPTFPIVCTLRAVMGLGIAFISCTSVSMVTESFPIEKRGWALGINTACVYIGLSVGPAIGGFLIDQFDWRFNFLAIIPFPVLALIMMRFVKLEWASEKTKFDYLGTAIYAGAMILTLYGLMSLPNYWAILLIVTGVVMIYVFIKMQLASELPLLDVKIFSNSVFSRSLIALVLNYAASYAVSFFMSHYLVDVGKLTESDAGLIIMIQPAVQVVITLFAGKLSDKMSDKRVLPTLGMLTIVVGLGILVFLEKELNYPMIITALAILGFGFGLFSAPNSSAIMSSVKHDQISEASAIMNTSRQVGMVLSMGIATVIINIVIGGALTETSSIDGFMDAMRYSWELYVVLGLIGAFFSWFRGSVEKE